MEDLLHLAARIAECGVLRYTPVGIPVLDLILVYESWQEENGQKCLIKLEVYTRILGKEAKMQQYRQNTMIEAEGFLTQRSQCFPQSILRIQKIKGYKG